MSCSPELLSWQPKDRVWSSRRLRCIQVVNRCESSSQVRARGGPRGFLADPYLYTLVNKTIMTSFISVMYIEYPIQVFHIMSYTCTGLNMQKRAQNISSSVYVHIPCSPGYPPIQGQTILEKRRYVRDNLDHLRKMLMSEPRGHADMYGALLVKKDIPEADLAVLFMHNEGAYGVMLAESRKITQKVK